MTRPRASQGSQDSPSAVAPVSTDALAAVATRTLAWVRGSWYWGDAIALDGLIEALPLLPPDCAEEVTATLALEAEKWAASAPDSWDDALAPGRALAALLEVERITAAPAARALEAFLRAPTTASGVPLLRPHVPEWRDLVWVDSLYHLPSGIARLGEGLGRPELRSTALRVAAATLEPLRLERGLAHCYDGGLGKNNGIPWSRGQGWALLGLLDLRSTVGPDSALDDSIAAVMDALVATQAPDGHWPTVLGQKDAATETSTAAFFVAAALHPALPASSVPPSEVVHLASSAVLAVVGDDGVYRGVSHDTHARWELDLYLHPQTRASPWGQGSALRALVALGRQNEGRHAI